MPHPLVYRFKVSLTDVSPLIWRLIVVPEWFTFFELHVAIQDAMGWKNCHSYMFYEFSTAPNQNIRIKRPHGPLPLSRVDFDIGLHFQRSGDTALYIYDLSCRWVHRIKLERTCWLSESRFYPECVGGERACPPEGLPGGVVHYARHVKALKDPNDPEHAQRLEYVASVGGTDKTEAFDYQGVIFSDAEELYGNGMPPPS